MLYVRSAAHFTFMVVWTLLIGVLYLPLMLLPRRAVMPFLQFWAYGILLAARVLCGVRWQVVGREHLPPGPCIFASKHQSAWETLFLPLLHNNFAYIFKRELLWLPVVGWYMKKSQMIAVQRGGGGGVLKQMLRASEAAVERGQTIIIFPEGTRTAPGADKDYHYGIAALYGRLGDRVPVIPIALNSGLFWPRNSWIKRPGTVTVEIMPAMPTGLETKNFLHQLKVTIDAASNDLCNHPPLS